MNTLFHPWLENMHLIPLLLGGANPMMGSDVVSEWELDLP
jgi:hypothetical protein